MTGAGTADFFYREALRLGYVARSAFKLLQLQKQYKLINPGASILDLGCAPGAWLQVACQSLGPLEKGGVVVGVDVKGRGFSVILSDMCPPVSGITTKDAALSCELGEKALSLAVGESIFSGSDEGTKSEACSGGHGVLQRGGNLVIKFLESGDIQEFGQFCKTRFKKSSWIRPKATRSSSREIYLVCQVLQ